MKSHSPLGRISETSTRLLVAIVFIAVATLTLIFAFSHEQWLAMNEQELAEQKIISVPHELIDLRAREDSILGSSAILDSAKATYRIPIERAMVLVESEAGK